MVTGKPPSPGYPSPVVTPPSDPLPIIEEPAKPPVPAKTTVFKSQGPENFETPKGSRGSPKYKTLKHRLVVEENDDEEDLEVKRLKFLERNRQAGMLHIFSDILCLTFFFWFHWNLMVSISFEMQTKEKVVGARTPGTF